MANEMQSTCSLRVTNGSLKSNLTPGTINITQAVAKGPAPGTVNVGTSAEVISFAELTTLGVIQITNLDATNYIEFGPDVGSDIQPAIRIEAGECWQFRLVPGVTYYAKANTGACNVQFMAFND
jgi:hypothetical protein